MTNKILKYYLSAFALFFIISVIIGIYNHYSPVPYWDMWNGTLGFYNQVQNGDAFAWIAQHNEHRILLSRILFWIDIHFFGGLSYFLMLCNFLLMLWISYVYLKIISHLFRKNDNIKYYLYSTVIVLIFSWIQNKNITWGFQSQFFLAYLFPLLSFYLLGRYSELKENKFYISSLIVGILSVFTMGNGILVLPILVVLGFILNISRQKQIIILLTTIVTLGLYFNNYVLPAQHGHLIPTLLNHPKDFFLYILTYLGGAIGNSFETNRFLIAQFFGLILIFSSLYYTYKIYKDRNSPTMLYALLAFIAYVGATAFGTAGGRVIFGVSQALSSRYMTPSLMVWVALLIVFVYYINFKSTYVKLINILFILIPLLFLKQQTHAFNINHHPDRLLATLALELSIHDEEYTDRIFPNYEILFKIATESKKNNISIFGEDRIRDISKKIGTYISKIPSSNFIGFLDHIQQIIDQKKFYRVNGWIYDKEASYIPESAFIINDSKKIIGYILTGFKRNDVASTIDKKAKYSGFYGYLIGNFSGKKFYIVDIKSNKKLEISLKKPLYTISKYIINDNDNLISTSNIISSSFLRNKTFRNKEIPKVAIYGSFINGDKFKGSILLKINKDSEFIIKTGPRTNGQIIKIYQNGKELYSSPLPISTSWAKIKLNINDLNLTVRVLDTSEDWGEWCAIGVKEENESK